MKSGVHLHSFKGARLGLNMLNSPGVVLLESGLSGFEHEFSDALSYPFTALSEADIEGVHTVIVDLPYEEMVNGKGKGYVLDLIDYIKADFSLDCHHLFDIKYPEWGCPVTGRRLLLVVSSTVVSLTSPRCDTTLTSILPAVAFHAPASQKRGIMHPGFYSMFGYTNSAGSVLPPVESWLDKYPLCEKRDGDTLRVARLNRQDIGDLWGYIPPHDSPAILLRVSPTIVLQRILDEIKLRKK